MLNFESGTETVPLLTIRMKKDLKLRVAIGKLVAFVGRIEIDNTKQKFTWQNLVAYFWGQSIATHLVSAVEDTVLTISSGQESVCSLEMKNDQVFYLKPESFLASTGLGFTFVFINWNFYLRFSGEGNLWFAGNGGASKLTNLPELRLNEAYILGYEHPLRLRGSSDLKGLDSAILQRGDFVSFDGSGDIYIKTKS